MRRTLIASFAIVALASAGWLASTGQGDASHSWGEFHWARTSNPFTLKVIDSATASFDPYLDVAITDWSDSSVLNLSEESGNSDSKTARRCAAASGKVRVCNTTYGNTGWLGIATIWASGSHIVQGTVKNNDTYFNTAFYNTPAWRQFVMCQEIGHTFGLAHQDETFGNTNLDTCMDYTNAPASNQHPNTHDYAQLETMYAHLDSTNSFSSGTTSGGPGNGNGNGAAGDDDPSDAVPAGATARDGRVFVRDLGGGLRVISVVIWDADFRGAAAPGRNDH